MNYMLMLNDLVFCLHHENSDVLIKLSENLQLKIHKKIFVTSNAFNDLKCEQGHQSLSNFAAPQLG